MGESSYPGRIAYALAAGKTSLLDALGAALV